MRAGTGRLPRYRFLRIVLSVSMREDRTLGTKAGSRLDIDAGVACWSPVATLEEGQNPRRFQPAATPAVRPFVRIVLSNYNGLLQVILLP